MGPDSSVFNFAGKYLNPMYPMVAGFFRYAQALEQGCPLLKSLLKAAAGTGETLLFFIPPAKIIQAVRATRLARATATAGRACSFAASTPVLMADGSRRPIADVTVGDLVVATDPETGEEAAKRVEQVFVHHDSVVDLVVEGEVLVTTEDHPFWSVTDQRFERADELSSGEQVLGADDRAITVSGLEPGTGHQALVYNLSVEGIHTYHVGENKILVHNTSTCPIHGNSLNSPKLTTLYRIDDAAGNLLKWGMTSQANPRRRYTETWLRNKTFTAITTGSRREISRIERWMVEHHRGPLNLERWAGGSW